MEALSTKFIDLVSQSSQFLAIFKGYSVPSLTIDVIIVTILFYWVYLFLHETRAMRILYGIFVLIALALVGRALNLILLNWMLQYLMAMLVVAIPIVFQPELRTALEKLGRAKFIGDLSSSRDESRVIDEMLGAIAILSKQKYGALIVIQRQTGLREYIENGTELDAKVSKDLLLSIFFPKSPLHDGAVIIVGDKIVAARSILPVSELYLNPSFGTRHRAGIGITEASDAIVMIVSEETGSVSMAVGGKIERRIPEDRLRNRLAGLFRQAKK